MFHKEEEHKEEISSLVQDVENVREMKVYKVKDKIDAILNIKAFESMKYICIQKLILKNTMTKGNLMILNS